MTTLTRLSTTAFAMFALLLGACASTAEPNGSEGWQTPVCSGGATACAAGQPGANGGGAGGGAGGTAPQCLTDASGTPTITCGSNADCGGCDPMHQVCDTGSKKCVPCTTGDTTSCTGTEKCEDNKCVPNCPTSCTTANDCGSCGGTAGHQAHACNANKCAQCSPTYACPVGQQCTANGTCTKKCGGDSAGSCQSDADCGGCGGAATSCHFPLNGGVGKCGVEASGCSDLGTGVVTLPAPFDRVTNTCSDDKDCEGVGASINVGKLLRDITGIHGIHDANITYPMSSCAALTVGQGDTSLSCGVCVPCRVDTDCQNINVDLVASQAFGVLGGLASGLLLTEVFGSNDHNIHMYCDPVAGGFGACVPCGNLLESCGGN
ncbi:MAG: hypothetical protein ABIP39_04175 [Polyangiaceae bacterium]